MIAPTNNDLSLSGLRAYNTFVRKDDSTLDPGGVSRYLEPNRIYNMIPLPSVDIRLTKVGESPDIYLEGGLSLNFGIAMAFWSEVLRPM